MMFHKWNGRLRVDFTITINEPNIPLLLGSVAFGLPSLNPPILIQGPQNLLTTVDDFLFKTWISFKQNRTNKNATESSRCTVIAKQKLKWILFLTFNAQLENLQADFESEPDYTPWDRKPTQAETEALPTRRTTSHTEIKISKTYWHLTKQSSS